MFLTTYFEDTLQIHRYGALKERNFRAAAVNLKKSVDRRSFGFARYVQAQQGNTLHGINQ